jgi:GNAT superfamily N-acetyltransferase
VSIDDVIVRMFQTADQFETKNLIEAGLKERFQPYLAEYNLDLNDLENSFLVLLVAISEDQIVACGGLKLEPDGTLHISRMSTKPKFRGHGLAQLILEQLIKEARDCGFKRLFLETNIAWGDAIRVYEKVGFTKTRLYMFDSTLELTEYELELEV